MKPSMVKYQTSAGWPVGHNSKVKFRNMNLKMTKFRRCRDWAESQVGKLAREGF